VPPRPDRLLRADDPALARTPDLARAEEVLRSYAPRSLDQEDERARLLGWIESYPEDAHLRSRLEGHLTAAALVLDETGERALLTHHRKLGKWLQLGGHCDGDANLPGVALRECIEECGIGGLVIDPVPIDVDVHAIPARPGEPAHLHLDTRFVVWAPRGARFAVSEESIELAWVAPGELDELEVDDSVRRLFEVVFDGSPGTRPA
jgi:8-oxo-dGTP pyrophosphatase MutT (NUDIX family)